MGPDSNKYFRFWSIKRPVFVDPPGIDKPFMIAAHEKIISAYDMLALGNGVLLLSAPEGAGKTTFANWLHYRNLHSRKNSTIFHTNANQLMPHWLLLQIGRYFDGNFNATTTPPGEAAEFLEEHLNQAETHSFILDINGSKLADDFLDDIQIISDLAMTTRANVSFTIFANEQIATTIRQSNLRSSIIMANNLPQLSGTDTANYINWRLQNRGLDNKIFNGAALRQLAKMTKGNFSQINSLAEISMLIAAEMEKKKITVEIISKAARFLPKQENNRPATGNIDAKGTDSTTSDISNSLEFFYIETDAG